VVRGQWTAHPRNVVIRQTAELDRERYGSVPTYIESPPRLAKESTDAIIRALAGFPVYADRVQKDKVTRAEPFAAQAEAGNVRLVQGAWNGAYIEELCAFPYGKHDNQVDPSSGAFNRMTTIDVTVHKAKPVPNRWAELGTIGRGNRWKDM
jgi:predicted phage terminase large subunit-like protein